MIEINVRDYSLHEILKTMADEAEIWGALKMNEEDSSEILATFYEITRCHNPEDLNLKSIKFVKDTDRIM